MIGRIVGRDAGIGTMLGELGRNIEQGNSGYHSRIE